MERKKFRKFILIDPEVFESFKNKSVPDSNLTTSEKAMLSVLRNKKLSPQQRLRYYQQLLFRNMRHADSLKNANIVSTHPQPHPPPPPPTQHPIRHEAAAQTKIVFKKDAAVGSANPEEIFYEHTPNVADINYPNIDIQKDVASGGGDGDNVEREKADEEARQLEHEFNISLYRDDDNFDLDEERQNLFDSIQRLSDGTQDLRDLDIEHFTNVDKDYVNVRNRVSGELFNVPKSDAMIDYQNRKKQQKPKKKSEIELLGARYNFSPSRTRSGTTRVTGWGAYQNFT